MNAKKLFTSCLLACSALAGAHAVADPMFTTQSTSTINSIEFSFMSYSSPLPNFSSMPLTSFDNSSPAPAASTLPVAAIPTSQQIQPVTEVFVPSTPGQSSTPPLIDTSVPPQQAADVVAAVIPEPGSVALLGLGLALLILRRREGFHA